MTRLHWLRAARRLLADQLLRLREALGDLAYRLRDSVASAVGDAVSHVARALLETDDRPHRPPRHDSLGWGDPEDRYWPESQHWAEERDTLDEEQHYTTEAKPPQSSSTGRWPRALIAGLQAACWWLRRGGRNAALGAAAVTVVTSIAARAGAPLLAAFVALVGSALGLIALVEAARQDASELAEAVTP